MYTPIQNYSKKKYYPIGSNPLKSNEALAAKYPRVTGGYESYVSPERKANTGFSFDMPIENVVGSTPAQTDKTQSIFPETVTDKMSAISERAEKETSGSLTAGTKQLFAGFRKIFDMAGEERARKEQEKMDIANKDIDKFGVALGSGRTEKYKSIDEYRESSPALKALNSPAGKKTIEFIADKTTDSPIKVYSYFQSFGNDTYSEALEKNLKKKTDPNNSEFENLMWEIQNSIPQTGIGVLLAIGGTILGRNKAVGTTLASSYWTALSANEQIQERGKVDSLANIGIDVALDSVLGNSIEGVLKHGGTGVLKDALVSFGAEGGTEVLQSYLKMGNDYVNADTDKEKNEIVEKAKIYSLNGGAITEFLVGGLTGSSISLLSSGISKINSTTRGDISNVKTDDVQIDIDKLQEKINVIENEEPSEEKNRLLETITNTKNYLVDIVTQIKNDQRGSMQLGEAKKTPKDILAESITEEDVKDIERFIDIAENPREYADKDTSQIETDARLILEEAGLNPEKSNKLIANDLKQVLDIYATNKFDAPQDVTDTLDPTNFNSAEEFLEKGVKKIKDVKTGNPIIIKGYHGTSDGRFLEEFDPTKKGYFKDAPELLPDNKDFKNIYGDIKKGFSSDTGVYEGISFTDDYNVAKSYMDKPAYDYQNSVPMVVERNIVLKNPKVVDATGMKQWEIKLEDIVEQAKKDGYDGVVFKGIKDNYHPNTTISPSNNIVIFSPEQIKTKQQLIDIWNEDNKGVSTINDKTNVLQKTTGDIADTRGSQPISQKTSIQVKYKKDGVMVFPGKTIESPADVAFAFKGLRDEAVEKFYAVGIKNNKPISVELISSGTLNASLVHPRETLGLLMDKGADSAYFIHNHPSGEIDPSQADMDLMGRLYSIGQKIGIESKGGIIIDTEKFAHFDSTGETLKFKHKEASKNPKKVATYKKYLDWTSKELDTTITRPKDIYELGKGINLDEDKNILVAYLNSRNQVISTEILPKDISSSVIFKNATKTITASVVIAGKNLEIDTNVSRMKRDFQEYGIGLLDVVNIDTVKDSFVSMLEEKKTEYKSGKQQIAEREQAKLDRMQGQMEKESLMFFGEIEDQYQSFKKLKNKNVADVEELKSKNKLNNIDSILYSQEYTDNELLEMFQDRLEKEKKPLTKIPKETKAIISETVRQKERKKSDVKIENEKLKSKKKIESIKTAKQILDSRRQKIKDVKSYFNLTDAELNKINNRDIRFMNNLEFKSFIDQMRSKTEKIEERRTAMNQLQGQISEKELENVENLRKAMKLTTFNNMSINDIKKLDKALEPYKTGDSFMSVRKLEMVDNTDLKGIKTWREAKERLAKEIKDRTGKDVSIDELSGLKVSEWDRFKWDSALAKTNPFYQLMVEKSSEKMLNAEATFLETKNKTIDLAKKIKGKGILNYLVPQYKNIRNWIENPDKRGYIDITKEEIALAEYMQEKFAEDRKYLIEAEAMKFGKENYFVHSRRGLLEAIKEDGLYSGIKEMFSSYKEEEAAFDIIDRDTGNVLALSKFFKNAMRRTGGLKPTENVVKAFLDYQRAINKKKALDSIVPLVDIYAQSITPTETTENGLLLHGNLIKFVKEWLNNKKGRHITLLAKQNGVADGILRGIKALTTIRDIGGNIAVGVASQVGEAVSNYTMLGKKRSIVAKSRQFTKQGRKIVEKYRNFIGENPWKELIEPAKSFGSRVNESLFIMFSDSAVRANKAFLLGMMTEEEFKSGEISDKRLAELKSYLGRRRVTGGGKSIAGSTPEGASWSQYKTWALPHLSTTIDDLKNIYKKVARKNVSTENFNRSILETIRAVEATLAMTMLFGIFRDEDDESFIGKLIAKAYRESTTIIQSLSPKTFASAGRTASFIKDLADNLVTLATLEEYKTGDKEGSLKGLNYLIKQFTPIGVSQTLKTETKEEVAPPPTRTLRTIRTRSNRALRTRK